MEQIKQYFKEKAVKILDTDYISLEEANKIIAGINVQKNSNNEDIEYNSKSLKEMFLYIIKNVYFWISVVFGILLISDIIALNFNKQIVWNKTVYEIFKIAFVLFNSIWISRTAAFYFDNEGNIYENGVPSPRTTARYISTSFITYVLISSFLYMYAVNFEALGVENLRDIIGTINIVTMLLASTQFILFRWFRKQYNFIFATTEDKNDSYTLWENLNLANKFYICIILFISILYIISQIYISVSQL